MFIEKFMVPRKRLELLHREATASKTVVSTNSTTWARYDELGSAVVYQFHKLNGPKHGGPGRIRTCEVVDKGFTVLPI